ncbi:phosphonate ABC transporter, permease protein PhnE [Hutsoniella sourekii]|uniref:phosphonate ABC transporter, permease protein PhnE n=1 Tax=Hutsoniella sourekii TaxID=87650 RepID=UPI000484A4A9|nr:phosphonate ABC transporter, permease protein PhnE [Hutsoniella sourekii]
MKRKDTIHDQLPQQLGLTLLIILLFLMAGSLIDADWSEVSENSNQAAMFLSGFLKPEWSYLPELIGPMIETLLMSVAGTFLGVVFAIPAAFLGTYVVTRNHFVTYLFRLIFSLIRTIPNLLLAAIFVAIVGIGEFTGVLTIAVFTFGMVSQLIFAAIETIDQGPIEADDSIGATRFQIAVNSVWPQVNQSVFGYALYAFEVNIRASAVLGYVGAGGIGVMLNSALSFFQFGRVSLIILIILVMVALTSWLSHYIRKEVI